jgi:hypothetical protein
MTDQELTETGMRLEVLTEAVRKAIYDGNAYATRKNLEAIEQVARVALIEITEKERNDAASR